ncbi:MAG: NAD-dependent epimerase/dehydratase family protein [Saprospiraceae bacterium]|nr:MAG: NAD-dependent epimerase/dehydratase family protein [Saprospiraceae bacterium]
MNPLFNLDDFISRHVTERAESLFLKDIRENETALNERIEGKSALVIGGAGSIGSSFIKALLHFHPARLVVVDINENGLTELTRDLRSTAGLVVPPHYLTYPINFGDAVFEKMLRWEGPFEIVANFAAHKHVRSEKDQYSIEAMLENNVLKAGRLLELLLENPPERFFCVSTDKAANPVNVMGASKKLMEEVILAYSRHIPITTARFANVAFSNGSLPAGFLERLMKQQPLSAPMDVKRYFVSPEESGQICLLACMLGNPGEIFFPKLLEERDMRRFSDIATSLLKSLGLEPFHCATAEEAREWRLETGGWGLGTGDWGLGMRPYPVYYFQSDTSGEKSFEEFYTDDEELDMDRFASLGVIKNAPCQSLAEIGHILNELMVVFEKENVSKQEIVELMQRYIPNFEHVETGRGLDQKM